MLDVMNLDAEGSAAILTEGLLNQHREPEPTPAGGTVHAVPVPVVGLVAPLHGVCRTMSAGHLGRTAGGRTIAERRIRHQPVITVRYRESAETGL
jgi:hypothetical protein